MRTLHLLASADRRGAEVFGVELARRLAARGGDGEVVALRGAVDPAHGLDVEVVPALKQPGAALDLRRRAKRADVVLGHGSHGLVAGTLATLGTRTPLVYRSIGDPTYWGASTARRLRVGLQLRRAAAVTALWPAAAEAIARQYGVDPARIEVVPNGVDEGRFSPVSPGQRAEARRALGMPADGLVIASIGALSPEKRIDLAVRAAAAVPDATLVLAGDGPDRAAIAALADQELPGRHRLLGAVEDVAPLYAAADLVIILSKTEGQPGVALEAGLCGLPVVATQVGGVPSVIDDRRTGVLVPASPTSADVAAAIAVATAQADELGAAARARCLDEFTLAAVTERFETVLERARQRRGAQRATSASADATPSE